MPLVCWPNIVEFLEDGLKTNAESPSTLPAREERLGSSVTPTSCNTYADEEHRDDQPNLSIRTTGRFDSSGGRKKQQNPEVTPESKVEGYSWSCDGGSSPCGATEDWATESEEGTRLGTMRLQQGLREIDEGLREVIHHGARLSPRTIHSTVQSIREILRAQAGVSCERPAFRRGASCSNEKEGQDVADQRMTTPAAPDVSGINQEKSDEFAGRLAAERLARVVCAASKRGHVSTLKVSEQKG